MNKNDGHCKSKSIQNVAALIILCAGYTGISVSPLSFGSIINGFSMSPAKATLATTSEILCISLASIVISFITKTLKPKPTIIIGVILLIIGQGLTIATKDFIYLVLVRGLTGFGEGICMAVSLASLARMSGGTKFLSYTTGLSAAFSLLAFIITPRMVDSLGGNSIFIFMLILGIVIFSLAMIFPDIRFNQLKVSQVKTRFFNKERLALVFLSIFVSIGANTCWLYFESVGLIAGHNLGNIGLIGGVSMLCAIVVPFFVNLAYRHSKTLMPLFITCICMAVLSYLYVVPNPLLFWGVSILMTFLYAFFVSFVRMYSSVLDSTGRNTAAVGGADALGMVIGPLVAAITLNLSNGFSELGVFGIVFQLVAAVPCLFLMLGSYRINNREALLSEG